MSAHRVLTGITTTGTLHLGNYVGAIRPAIEASRAPGVESFFFMADFHALIKCDEPDRIARSSRAIAATWVAAGLDTERVTLYRQSDIPEIPELTWLLNCVTAKGMMNRAHAYKAAVDAAVAAGEEPDANVSMGLFSYPVLMAADILMFNAHRVPVGKDQVQHIEMARDVGQRFNHLFGQGQELFTLPEAQVDAEMELLPGLDGRKMSKSYDNVIPLFEGGSAALKDAIARIVTDSKLPGEPKDPQGQAIVTIYDAFATPEQRAAFRAALRGGLGWGEAKQQLVALIDGQIGPMRARYDELMANPDQLEAILQAGAARARAIAAPFLKQLRAAVGLRPYTDTAKTAAAKAEKAALPVFKQYREADGKFYFKLLSAGGDLLLQSHAFEQGRDAGQWVARLKREGLVADAPVQREASDADITAALAAFKSSRDVADITELLLGTSRGDAASLQQLYALLYPEIKRVARIRLAQSGPNGRQAGLNTTALVHEGFLRMADQQGLQGETRGQFFAYVGRVLRSVVIDHLRTEGRDKRGGDAVMVTLSAASDVAAVQSQAVDMVGLDQALERMRALDTGLYELIEMVGFAGLSIAEVAELRGLSTRSINRELLKARALLQELLGDKPDTVY